MDQDILLIINISLRLLKFIVETKMKQSLGGTRGNAIEHLEAILSGYYDYQKSQSQVL